MTDFTTDAYNALFLATRRLRDYAGITALIDAVGEAQRHVMAAADTKYEGHLAAIRALHQAVLALQGQMEKTASEIDLSMQKLSQHW